MSTIKPDGQNSFQLEFDLNGDGHQDLISIAKAEISKTYDYRVVLKERYGGYSSGLYPKDLLQLLRENGDALANAMGAELFQGLEFEVATDGLAEKLKRETVEVSGTNEARVHETLRKAYTRLATYSEKSGASMESLKRRFSQKFYDQLPFETAIELKRDTAVEGIIQQEMGSDYSAVDRGIARQIWEKGAWTAEELRSDENQPVRQGLGNAFDASEHPVTAIVAGTGAVLAPPFGAALAGAGVVFGGAQSVLSSVDYHNATNDEEKLQSKIGIVQGATTMGSSAVALKGAKGMPSAQGATLAPRVVTAAVPDSQLTIVPVRAALPGPVAEVPAPITKSISSPKTTGSTTVVTPQGQEIIVPPQVQAAAPKKSFSHPVVEETPVASTSKPTKVQEGPTAVDQSVDGLLNPAPAKLPAVVKAEKTIPYASWGRPNADVDVLPGDTLVYEPTPLDPDAGRYAGVVAGITGDKQASSPAPADDIMRMASSDVLEFMTSVAYVNMFLKQYQNPILGVIAFMQKEQPFVYRQWGGIRDDQKLYRALALEHVIQKYLSENPTVAINFTTAKALAEGLAKYTTGEETYEAFRITIFEGATRLCETVPQFLELLPTAERILPDTEYVAWVVAHANRIGLPVHKIVHAAIYGQPIDGQGVYVGVKRAETLIRFLGTAPTPENIAELEAIAGNEDDKVSVNYRRVALTSLPSSNNFTAIGDIPLGEADIVRLADYMPTKHRDTDPGADFRRMVRDALDQYNIDRQTKGAREAFRVLVMERLRFLIEALGFLDMITGASRESLMEPGTVHATFILGMSGIPSDPNAAAAKTGLKNLFLDLQELQSRQR